MPLGMQAKLLRVLEDFQFRRLGSRQELKADVRNHRRYKPGSAEGHPGRQVAQRRPHVHRVNVFHLEAASRCESARKTSRSSLKR